MNERSYLNVGINAVSAKSGGAATYICNLRQQLDRINAQFKWVFYVPPETAMRATNDTITFMKTSVGYRSSGLRFSWDQVVLRKLIKKQKINVLLSSSDFGMFFPPCRQILMIRNPLFFSEFYVRNILPHKSWRFRCEFLVKRQLISLSARFSDVVITASRSMLDDVRRVIPIPDCKAIVNHFGVPLDKFKGRVLSDARMLDATGQTTQDKILRLLYVSEYSDYKNLTTLLKAVGILKEKGAAKFCLTTTASPDDFPDVEIASRETDNALLSDSRISSSVKVIGPIGYETIPMLYEASDIFVFPSLAESFGHPLVEAMASGLPIVASDIPIHREICGGAAVYFSPLCAEDLADKILLLGNDRQLMQHLGQTGRTRVEEGFKWTDHVRRLLETIEHLGKRKLG